MRIVTLNPGSSSIKASLMIGGDAVSCADWNLSDGGYDAGTVHDVLHQWRPFDAVSIRFVHGGTRTEPTLIDDALLGELEKLTPFAPLHQPLSLSVARDVQRYRPVLPAVACFDTAFHVGMPEAASVYPVPQEWDRCDPQNSLRRFGFHGLSYQYAIRRTAKLLNRDSSDLQFICAHVGAGVSVTAIRNGLSVDTSMGLTPLEGAMMATRSGSIDPGLLLHVMRTMPMTVDQMSDALYRRSGLAGLSGTTGDFRELIAAAAQEPAARLAIAVYLHRLRREIGAAAMGLERLDALVFTGGVAEHQSEVIDNLIAGLSVLGIQPGICSGAGDRLISVTDAKIPVLIVVSREDQELALAARKVLAQREFGSP